MPEFKLPSSPKASASVSELMEAATRVFRTTLAKSLPVAMLANLFAALAGMYWMTTGKPMSLLHPPDDARFWGLTLFGLAGYQWLAAVLMLRQHALVTRAVPDLQQEWRFAAARWPLLMVSAILAGVGVFAGLLALLVPGVFAFVCFLLLRPVVLFEKLDAVQSLGRCIKLVSPLWTKVLAAVVIATLVIAICALAAAACVGIFEAVLTAAGAPPAAVSAFGAACSLGVQAVALVYFSALWLVLYSAASSSA